MASSHIAAIIPAAGLSARMGSANKLLMDVDGLPLIESVTCATTLHTFSQVIVVTGHDAEIMESRLRNYAVDIVFNPDYNRGMGSSLKTGIAAALAADGYLIWPADMPYITRETVSGILDSYDSGSIVVPVFERRRGHPVLFGSDFFNALQNIPDNEGARAVLSQFEELVVELTVEDEGVLRDIDTPEDLS